jgi:hypothetical protein
MLFDLKKEKEKAIEAQKKHAVEQKSHAIAKTFAKSTFIESIAKKELEGRIGELEEGRLIEFHTDGAWSLHHLLEHCLIQCGVSKLYACTWGLSEDPARAIVEMKNSGLISELHFLFDHRIRNMNPAPIQMLTGVCDTFGFVKTHAKIISILGEKLSLAIISSSNFTKNPRFEAGFVHVSKESAEFHKKGLLERIHVEKQ